MTPPRWGEQLLKLCLPRGLTRDSILGDMAEEFDRRADTSRPAARRWYLRQSLGVSAQFAINRLASVFAIPKIPFQNPLAGAFTNALRSLRRAPTFSLATTLTLAVGIGATATVFSVVDGVLLRALPYPASEDLVSIISHTGDRELPLLSEPEFHDVVEEINSFSAAAAHTGGQVALGSSPEPERLSAVFASASLTDVLRVEPIMGRWFDVQEDLPGSSRVIVISYGLWQRTYAGDPQAVGSTMIIDDQPHTVIGIMPSGFSFPITGMQAWLPLRLDLINPFGRNNKYLRVVARLGGETGPTAAAAELDALAIRSAETFPEFYAERIMFRPHLLKEQIVSDARRPLLLLLGAVAGLLLVASTNTAGLFLARGERRRIEVAIRTALGAARSRVAAQLLMESLLIATLAGGLGVLLAYGGVAGISLLGTTDVPRLAEVTVDLRVFAFGLATAVLTGLFFGSMPAIQAGRNDVRQVLTGGSRGSIGSKTGARFQRNVVIAQLAVATMLVLGSTLLIRSLAIMGNVDLGIRPNDTLIMPLVPTETAVAPNEGAVTFYQALEERIEALPGVMSAGAARSIPIVDGHDRFSIHVEGRVETNVADAPVAGMQWATPGYFSAIGISLKEGRLFGRQDHAAARLVAVVSDGLAAELWPGESAIGKRLRMWVDGSPSMEVVGIVGDVKHNGPQVPAPTMLYIPHLQGYLSGYTSPNGMSLILRTTGDPTELAGPVRAIVREIAPTVPIGTVRTGDEIAARALARDRFTVRLLGLFALAALLLGAVGVYGVISQGVRARTKELGLRMAIGASGKTMAGEVLRDGLIVGAQGAAIGLAGGAVLSRQLQSLLFEVSPLDPWAYFFAIPTLALVVLIATGLPAWRAARLDPVRALRGER